MEGVVHRMVMQTLKCVYHKVLEVGSMHATQEDYKRIRPSGRLAMWA